MIRKVEEGIGTKEGKFFAFDDDLPDFDDGWYQLGKDELEDLELYFDTVMEELATVRKAILYLREA
jgi:hypothetical protein